MATSNQTGAAVPDRLTWLEPEEIDTLLYSLAASRTARGEGFTEADARALIEWAQHVRVESAVLSLALKGAVQLDWDEAQGGVVCTSRVTLGVADADADASTGALTH